MVYKSEAPEQLQIIADSLRLDVVRMVHHAGDGHPGPALSCADIIAYLYFNEMNIRPEEPRWEERDRFILSKGHACTVLYAALAERGYFPKEELSGLRSLNSILQGHPTMQKTPGIDMTSGSLGNGLPIAVGMAIAARSKHKSYHTYVLIGDGELEEGVVWEAVMCAKRYGLSNLTAIVDNNGWQSGGRLEECSGILPIKEKWEAFGWHVQEIDGHNFDDIAEAFKAAKAEEQAPSVIIARTVKGKGLDFMENDNSWHKRVPSDEQLAIALEVLGGKKL